MSAIKPSATNPFLFSALRTLDHRVKDRHDLHVRIQRQHLVDRLSRADVVDILQRHIFVFFTKRTGGNGNLVAVDIVRFDVGRVFRAARLSCGGLLSAPRTSRTPPSLPLRRVGA